MGAAQPGIESVNALQNLVHDMLDALIPLCEQEAMEEKSWEGLGELLPEVSAAVSTLAASVPEGDRPRVQDLAGKLQEVVQKMTDIVQDRAQKRDKLKKALEALQRGQNQAGEWLRAIKV